jgi:hypothetical protein
MYRLLFVSELGKILLVLSLLYKVCTAVIEIRVGLIT